MLPAAITAAIPTILRLAGLVAVPYGISSVADVSDELLGTDLKGRRRDALNIAKFMGESTIEDTVDTNRELLRQESFSRRADDLEAGQTRALSLMSASGMEPELGLEDLIQRERINLGRVAAVMNREPSLEEAINRLGYV